MWCCSARRRVSGRLGLGKLAAGENFLVEGAGRLRLAAARRLAPFVDVLGVARRASRLLDVFVDHRDHGVIGHAPLARTVVVQNVTETQPALLHYSTSPELFLKDGLG